VLTARAWLAAASAVKAAGGDVAHKVIIDIANPVVEDLIDIAVIQEVDGYLRAHNTWPPLPRPDDGPAHQGVARRLKIAPEWARYRSLLQDMVSEPGCKP
jgi:hypothetical protein